MIQDGGVRRKSGLNNSAYDVLAGIEYQVSPDGEVAAFEFRFDQRPPVDFIVFLNQIAHFLHEVRSVSNLMVNAQRLTLSRGADRLPDFCSSALHPKYNDCMIDPWTGDRIFVMQFAHHSPLAIRLTESDVEASVEKMQAAIRRASN